MRSILSLGLAAVAASTAAADTTVAVLEFGPGGSVHRTTSPASESSAVAVSSLWDALHRPTATKGSLHAGMAVAPDLFASPDAGIVVGISGEGLRSMPTALSLMDDHQDVVGHVHVPGPAAAGLMKKAASKDAEAIAKEEVGSRLASVAEAAARGELEGMEALSLTVDTAEAAAAADEHLGRMLATLKTEAAARKKTVVVHLVAEEGGSRRRLEENQGEDGENQNNNNNNNGQSSSSNYKSMYEIQTFNLYLWTAVGLFVVVYSVIGCFIDMPQFPDTLLYGETKMGAD